MQSVGFAALACHIWNIATLVWQFDLALSRMAS
jgi:hypothetical protein